MAAEPFSYESEGRKLVTGLVLLAIWAALIIALLGIDLAPWIAFLVVLVTLPALYDMLINPHSQLFLDADALIWECPRSKGAVPLAQIDHIRLDTRLDLSVRASVILKTGRKLRLPFEVTPPPDAFQRALTAHGIRAERHHFSLVG